MINWVSLLACMKGAIVFSKMSLAQSKGFMSGGGGMESRDWGGMLWFPIDTTGNPTDWTKPMLFDDWRMESGFVL